MPYQTLVVLAISAIFTFLILSVVAAGVSALRRSRGGTPPRQGGRWARLRAFWRSGSAC